MTLLYFFSCYFICYWQKEPIKVQMFWLLATPMKINQISYVIFQTTSQMHHPSVSWHKTHLKFFSSALYILQKKVSQNSSFKIFECSSEVHQIPHVINATTLHFSFKACTNLQYVIQSNDLLCTLLAQKL